MTLALRHFDNTLCFILAALVISIYSSESSATLHLLGGAEHDEFLGCIDCPKLSSNSICNEFGKGNEFADTIFNEFAEYGNEFSSSSPWNKFSSSKSVPILVDEHGKFYGYFTINILRSDAVPFSNWLKNVYEAADGDLETVRTIICKSF